MKPIKNLAQYYVDLLVKLGILRFSILRISHRCFRGCSSWHHISSQWACR